MGTDVRESPNSNTRYTTETWPWIPPCSHAAIRLSNSDWGSVVPMRCEVVTQGALELPIGKFQLDCRNPPRRHVDGCDAIQSADGTDERTY
jgi:hypothetical protein